MAEHDWLGDAEAVNDIGTLRQFVKDLTELQLSPGKKYLDKFLRHEYNAIMADIAGSSLPSLDAALAQEYQKGRAFQNLQNEFVVDNLIAGFKERIEKLQAQEQFEDEDDE